jgi:hypothetical protein
MAWPFWPHSIFSVRKKKKKKKKSNFQFFFPFFSALVVGAYLRDREARLSASTLTERQTRLLASDDSMSAYLLGLSGARDDLALGVNRPRRSRAQEDAARRPSALAEAASSGTLDYLMSRRFVPNAAVGALSGAASPVGSPAANSAAVLSPTRSVDEFESPRRLIYDDDEDYGAVTHGWRGFDRFRVQSRALDASAAPAAGINDGSSLGVALASRFGAGSDGRSAYSAAPLDAQVRRVSKLAGILGIYGEDDPDSDDDEYDPDDNNAGNNNDNDVDDRRQLGAFARRRKALGDSDDEPRGKLSLRAPIGDEYRASVDRALRRLGIDHLLPTWRERVRQWLAAAIFKPLAALMQREEQAPLVAAQQPAAATVAKPSMFGTPFGKSTTATATPAAAMSFGTPAASATKPAGTSLFGSTASKTTTPTTPKTPPRRFGSTESLFSSPRPSASAPTTTTATPGASSFSFGKPTTGSFGFGSTTTTSTATASKSLFPTSFPTTSTPASMFGASGARAVDEVKEPREQLKAYLRVLGCTTPEYVAQRLRELARGTCLGDYHWNGGGSWNGKPWTSDLPTDAQIVLHAFCTYMDALLPAQSSARAAAFTDNHVVAAPITSSKITSSIMLFQAHLHPPHIDVLFKKYLVPLQRGASNLFDALCVFLYCVERERDGFIGFVSLADRGVRLLDVVQ